MFVHVQQTYWNGLARSYEQGDGNWESYIIIAFSFLIFHLYLVTAAIIACVLSQKGEMWISFVVAWITAAVIVLLNVLSLERPYCLKYAFKVRWHCCLQRSKFKYCVGVQANWPFLFYSSYTYVVLQNTACLIDARSGKTRVPIPAPSLELNP